MRMLEYPSRTYAAAAPEDERSADGIPNVHVEQQRQHGHNDHAAAESGERAEQAGDEGSQRDEGAEFKNVHPEFAFDCRMMK